MNADGWFSQLSTGQRYWFFGALVAMLVIVGVGIMANPAGEQEELPEFGVAMSIRDIAPALNVTGKALARELGLQLDVPKNKPLGELGVGSEELEHAVHHLLSHRDTKLKYYVFAALVLGGLIFLVKL